MIENKSSDSKGLMKETDTIRIYALSKQLNIDVQEILVAVKQLGIENKGSSLARLTNDEIELVKNKLDDPKYIDPKYHERQQRYEESRQKHKEEEKKRREEEIKRNEERRRRPIRIGDLAEKYGVSVKIVVDASQKLVGRKRSYVLTEDDTLTKEETESVAEKLDVLVERHKKNQPDNRHNKTEWADADGIVRPPLWGDTPTIYLKDGDGNFGEYTIKR